MIVTICRLEFLVAQYDSDKKNKLEKWETWKVKIRSILAFNQTRLDDLKTEGPASDPSKVEEQVVKAKVSDNNFEFWKYKYGNLMYVTRIFPGKRHVARLLHHTFFTDLRVSVTLQTINLKTQGLLDKWNDP